MIRKLNYRFTRFFLLFGFIMLFASACSYFSEENLAPDDSSETNQAKKEDEKVTELDELEMGDEQTIAVSSVPSGKIYFHQTEAVVNDGVLIVKGRIKARFSSPSTVAHGHVDIKVLDGDDILLKETSVYQSPRVIRRKGGPIQGSKFEVQIPMKIPEDSRVELWFHREREIVSTKPH